MDSILVPGAAGFVGSCFVRQWLGQQRGRLTNLDKLTYAGNLDSLCPVTDSPDYLFMEGDIGDTQLVAELLADRQPVAIVKFAAESHVDRSIDGPAQFVQTNVVGTCNLLAAALEYWRSLEDTAQSHFRFLHVSTDEVY